MDARFVLYFVVPIVLGFVILLAGVVLVSVAGRRRKRAGEIDITDWGITGGKVLSARMEERETPGAGKDGAQTQTTYSPVVDYVFAVQDVEHHGNTVFAGNDEGLARAAAQEILDQYPPNSYVPVRYNPENLAESALMPHPHRPDYVWMAGLLFTGFGFSVCCFTMLMSFIIVGGIQ
jgi:hypothetical protein